MKRSKEQIGDQYYGLDLHTPTQENKNTDADSSIFTISKIWKQLKLLNLSNKEMDKEIWYVSLSVCTHVCMLSISVLSIIGNPMDCNPPDSSLLGILQASILK